MSLNLIWILYRFLLKSLIVVIKFVQEMLDQIKNFSLYDVNCANFILWIECLQMILLIKIDNFSMDQFFHRCGIEASTKPGLDQIV